MHSKSVADLSLQQVDALYALSVLHHRELHPIYACGRDYLVNLTRWREFITEKSGTPSRDRHDVPHAGPPRDDGSPVPSLVDASPSGSSKVESPLVSPSECPNTLLSWRASVIEWLFDLADSFGCERNTAIVALAYLDAYSMYCLFPQEFESRTTSIEANQFQNHRLSHFHGGVGSIDQRTYITSAIASFCTASKLHQTFPSVFTVRHASKVSRGEVKEEDIEEMERAMVKTLTFHLNPPTPGLFLKEILVLILPHGSDGEFGKRTILEYTLLRQSSYLADLVSYSCSFPKASSARPSKVALAAVMEAINQLSGKNMKMIQERVTQLSFLPETGGIFDYDDETKEIQTCMGWILRHNGDSVAMKELARSSPVTVLSETDLIRPAKKIRGSKMASSRDYTQGGMKNESKKIVGALANQGTRSCVMERVAPVTLAGTRPSCSEDLDATFFDQVKPKMIKRV